MGPTVTRLEQDPLAVLLLDNRLYILNLVTSVLFSSVIQTTANRGPDLRFVLEAIIKALMTKSS